MITTRIRKMNSDYQTLITSRYPTEFKQKVILYAEKHNNSEAERIFGIAESNIRRWRKLKSLIFSKAFVSDSARKKRLVKKVAQNNDDFIYEIEKLDHMFSISGASNKLKQSGPHVKDYSRNSKSDGTPKVRLVATSPALSPILRVPQQEESTPAGPAESEEVCLRWNSHHNNMRTTFPSLLQREQYVDVTLSSEGKSIKCHRLILSSCSAYFDELLQGISPLQHPVIFLTGVSFWVLKSLIDFMYAGEVQIDQSKLETLLKVAEMLQIKGLTGKATQPETEDGKITSPPTAVPVKTERRTPEPKNPQPKKEVSPNTTTASAKTPLKKNVSPAPLMSSIDPLSLLEPTFFEEAPVPLRFKEHTSTKKSSSKKMKRRKLSEHEVVSPPQPLYRKGTKSRPHVKVPRYYHNDYEGVDGKKLLSRQELASASMEQSELTDVKIESLIIEQTDMQGVERRKNAKEILGKAGGTTSVKKQIVSERKMDVSDESKSNESISNKSEAMEGMVDVGLAKEIKEEQIEFDFADISNVEDPNATI